MKIINVEFRIILKGSIEDNRINSKNIKSKIEDLFLIKGLIDYDQIGFGKYKKNTKVMVTSLFNIESLKEAMQEDYNYGSIERYLVKEATKHFEECDLHHVGTWVHN